jgi:acetyl/propionyl-CoA carboxylase alpha subunit
MRYRYQNGDRIFEVLLERDGDAYRATLDGETYPVEILDQQPGQISVRFAGRPMTLFFASDGSQKWLSLDGCTYRLEKPSPTRRARAPGDSGGPESVRAPMPAQVRALQVAEGETVEKGQTLLLLEAMKMEIRIKAPSGGRVTRLLVASGQSVEKEQVLVEIGA